MLALRPPKRKKPVNPALAYYPEDDGPLPVAPSPTFPSVVPVPLGPVMPTMPGATPPFVAPPMDADAMAMPRPVNPFLGGRPTRAEVYGQPTITATGGPTPRILPVNPATTVMGDVAAPVVKAKSRREQLQEQIRERQNKKFTEKRGVMNTLKSAGIGFLTAFAQNAGMPLHDRLIASLGGAGAGAIGGTVNPNLSSQIMNQQKLAGLYDQYGQATEMEAADAKAAKAQQDAIRSVYETEGAGIKNVNERVGDVLKTYSADKRIEEWEAENLRKLTGLPYSAQDWRAVIAFDDQGVPFIRREGDEKSRIDPSRPLNPAEFNKERKIEGQGTFTVPDSKSFGSAANMAVGNANRQQSASQYQQTQETQAQNREFDNQKDYDKEVRARNNRVRGADAKVAGAQKRLGQVDQRIEQLEAQKASMRAPDGTPYDTSEIDKLIESQKDKKAAAEADIAAGEVEKNEPAPTLRKRPVNPKTSKGGKNDNIGTDDAYEKARARIRPRY